jgi:hypothetical protein
MVMIDFMAVEHKSLEAWALKICSLELDYGQNALEPLDKENSSIITFKGGIRLI